MQFSEVRPTIFMCNAPAHWGPIGLLGRVISPPQGLYLNTEQTHTHTEHPCPEWDSNPWSQYERAKKIHTLNCDRRHADVLGGGGEVKVNGFTEQTGVAVTLWISIHEVLRLNPCRVPTIPAKVLDSSLIPLRRSAGVKPRLGNCLCFHNLFRWSIHQSYHFHRNSDSVIKLATNHHLRILNSRQ
jgi:hypothetical protein